MSVLGSSACILAILPPNTTVCEAYESYFQTDLNNKYGNHHSLRESCDFKKGKKKIPS